MDFDFNILLNDNKNEFDKKIIDIIKKENRKLNALDLMKKINKNFTAKELEDLIEKLHDLCKNGILKTTDGNSFKLNDVLTGTVDLHEKGNAHVLIKGHEDMFVPRNLMKGASNKDTVIVEYTNEEKNEGRIVKVINRSLGKAIGEVMNIDGKIIVKSLEKDLPYEIEVEDSDMNLVDGLLVHLAYVKDITKNKVLAKVDSVICHKNAPGRESDIAKIACEFGLRLEFSEEAKEEARKMPKCLTKEMIEEELNEGREDFRNDIIFTIDGKDTKDIDDAISLKILPNGNYQLGVHIADVSHYVKPGMAIWKEAEMRGNSNYLGNKVIPMLLVELSNGICSLNPNEDRFTISCVMEVDHSGKAISRKIVKGIINSRKKMNYDAVQDIIDDKDTEDTKDYTTLKYIAKSTDTLESIAFENNITVEELLSYNKELSNSLAGSTINIPCRNIIKNMYALSKKISGFKERRGELRFAGDETKIIMDENDEVVDIKARDQRPAERLIEDFMVIANEQVAEFLTEYDIATYRVHEKPLEKKITDYLKFLELLGIHYPGKINAEYISPLDCQKLLRFLEDQEMFKALNKKMLRSMTKAKYSTENAGHFGIASPCYTHFTSPIRRLDDLLNHLSITMILKYEALEKKFIKQWRAYLTTMCESASENERNSEKCEYAVDDMLKASYMEKHIGEEFEGTVDSLMPTAFFVQTSNYIDGRVDVLERGENQEIGVSGYYDYNENLMAYTRNGRVDLRYGDKVMVRCIAADREKREVDFALVRKL